MGYYIILMEVKNMMVILNMIIIMEMEFYIFMEVIKYFLKGNLKKVIFLLVIYIIPRVK
jgi:hypothetical protein